jgi:HEPN domain-containing protein
MFDLDKQVAYWRDGSEEDWTVAQELVDNGRIRHGLFFAHLALEKMLKAHVCRATNNVPPQIHNLVRLAKIANLPLANDQRVLLGRFNQYQLEGRYPEELPQPLTKREAKNELKAIEEILEWLKNQF